MPRYVEGDALKRYQVIVNQIGGIVMRVREDLTTYEVTVSGQTPEMLGRLNSSRTSELVDDWVSPKALEAIASRARPAADQVDPEGFMKSDFFMVSQQLLRDAATVSSNHNRVSGFPLGERLDDAVRIILKPDESMPGLRPFRPEVPSIARIREAQVAESVMRLDGEVVVFEVTARGQKQDTVRRLNSLSPSEIVDSHISHEALTAIAEDSVVAPGQREVPGAGSLYLQAARNLLYDAAEVSSTRDRITGHPLGDQLNRDVRFVFKTEGRRR